jgi:hypothetical protein
MLEFVAAFVSPLELPAAAEAWRSLQALKRAVYEAPWSAAVLRVIELADYRALPGHEPGWIARRLAITPEQEEEAIDLLLRTGQLRRRKRRLTVDHARAVDARQDPEATRRMREFWSEVGLSRLKAGAEGIFSYNVFTVSAADYQRVRELHRSYFRELRSLIAQSEPSERLLLTVNQLLPLVRSDDQDE